MRFPLTRRSIAAGFIGGAVLVLAAPAMAGAHVGVSPDALAAGDHGVLTFSFAHGCENSPTTSLTITMPPGLTSVAPTADGDWSIDMARGSDGLVNTVTYTALTPVTNGLRGEVSMSVGLDEDAPDSLAFPVTQRCVEGVTEWTQLAENGEDPHSLDTPAPVVEVTAEADSHGAAAEHTSSPSTDSLGTVLGAGGLVAGLAALVVAVLAYRRRA